MQMLFFRLGPPARQIENEVFRCRCSTRIYIHSFHDTIKGRVPQLMCFATLRLLCVELSPIPQLSSRKFLRGLANSMSDVISRKAQRLGLLSDSPQVYVHMRIFGISMNSSCPL